MPNNTLQITEIFSSVQGETSFSGLPTTFVRLSGCPLRCTWCDTTYSFKRGTAKSLDVIIAEVEFFGCKHVCITGGEPLIQKNVHSLMTKLCDLNYTVSLETAGAYSIADVDPRVHTILDIKCPGSGMSEKNYWPNLSMLRDHDEVKFVVKDAEDYLYAKNISEKYHLFDRNLPILLSPVHGELDPKTLISWILKDKLTCRLNLQIHKYIWSPETMGV